MKFGEIGVINSMSQDMGESTLGSRGQHLGEYAVMIGVVATALVGTQLYVSKRVAGRLIGMSEGIEVEGQVLGLPPQGMSEVDQTAWDAFLAKEAERKAALGGDRDDSTSTVSEEGTASLIHTVQSSKSAGRGISGVILAEAYGPWIAEYLTFAHQDMSAAQLAAFLADWDPEMQEEDVAAVLKEMSDEAVRELTSVALGISREELTRFDLSEEEMSASLDSTREELEERGESEETIRAALDSEREFLETVREARRDVFRQLVAEKAGRDPEELRDPDALQDAVDALVSQELPEGFTVATLNNLAFSDLFQLVDAVREDPEKYGTLSALIRPREGARGEPVEMVWGLAYEFVEKMELAGSVVQAQELIAMFDTFIEAGEEQRAEIVSRNPDPTARFIDRIPSTMSEEMGTLLSEIDTMRRARGALAALFEEEGLAVDADNEAVWDRETEALQALADQLAALGQDADGAVGQALALIRSKSGPITLTIMVGGEPMEVTIEDQDGDGVLDVSPVGERGDVARWLDLDGQGAERLVPLAATALASMTEEGLEAMYETWQADVEALINERIPNERVRESVQEFLKRFDQKKDGSVLSQAVEGFFADVEMWAEFLEDEERAGTPLPERTIYNNAVYKDEGMDVLYRDILPDHLSRQEENDDKFIVDFLLNELKPALEDIAENDDLYGAYAFLGHVGKGEVRGKSWWEHIPFTGGPAQTSLRREDNAALISETVRDEGGNLIMTRTAGNNWTLEGGIYDGVQGKEKLIFHEGAEWLPIGIDTNDDGEVNVWFGSFDGGQGIHMLGTRDEGGRWDSQTPLTITEAYEVHRDAETGESLGGTTRYDYPTVPRHPAGYSTDGNPDDAEMWVVRDPDSGAQVLILDANGNHVLEETDGLRMGQRIEVHPPRAQMASDTPEPIGISRDVVQHWMEVNDQSGHRVEMLGDHEGTLWNVDQVDQLPDVKEDGEGNYHQIKWIPVYDPNEVGRPQANPVSGLIEQARRVEPINAAIEWFSNTIVQPVQDFVNNLRGRSAPSVVQVLGMRGDGPTIEELNAAQIHPSRIGGIDVWRSLKPDALPSAATPLFRPTGGMRSITDVTLPQRRTVGPPGAQIRVPGVTQSIQVPQGKTQE